MGQNVGLQQPSQDASAPSTWSLKPCTESKFALALLERRISSRSSCSPFNDLAGRKEDRYRRAAKTTNLWERASAAVWKYDADSKELAITWLGDDGSKSYSSLSLDADAEMGRS